MTLEHSDGILRRLNILFNRKRKGFCEDHRSYQTFSVMIKGFHLTASIPDWQFFDDDGQLVQAVNKEKEYLIMGHSEVKTLYIHYNVYKYTYNILFKSVSYSITINVA